MECPTWTKWRVSSNRNFMKFMKLAGNLTFRCVCLVQLTRINNCSLAAKKEVSYLAYRHSCCPYTSGVGAQSVLCSSKDAGKWEHGGVIAPLSFQKGATVAQVPFHNSIIDNFMVYQSRLDTNLSQLFAAPENSEWLSISYLFDGKPRLTIFFIILCDLLSRAAYIFYIFTLSKYTDNVHRFLGYVFVNQTLFSHSILFSITCTSVTGGIMMNRRQLQWWDIITRVTNKHETC